eukprot:g8099.t1
MRSFLLAVFFLGVAVGERAIDDDATLMAERAGQGDQEQQPMSGTMGMKTRTRKSTMAVMSKKTHLWGKARAKIMMDSLRKKEKDSQNSTEVRLRAYQVTYDLDLTTNAEASEKAFKCWAKEKWNFQKCNMNHVCIVDDEVNGNDNEDQYAIGCMRVTDPGLRNRCLNVQEQRTKTVQEEKEKKKAKAETKKEETEKKKDEEMKKKKNEQTAKTAAPKLQAAEKQRKEKVAQIQAAKASFNG